MADETIASIIPLHQPKKAKTGAQRARAYRQRKRQKAKAAASPNKESPSSESLIPEGFSSADSAFAEPPFTRYPTVTLRAVARDEDAPSRSISPILLRAAALALAGVGIAMNGWFARSLGSSDAAGWLFLAIGVAADLIALVVPFLCGQALASPTPRHFACGMGRMGDDVRLCRNGRRWLRKHQHRGCHACACVARDASRRSGAGALSDAMSARDRECKGGVGKFCRERELGVNERRQALDTAMQAVGQTADPQTDAAIRLVAWATHGALQPTGNDFAMLRLVLLALLPQIGGILLMVGRSTK